VRKPSARIPSRKPPAEQECNRENHQQEIIITSEKTISKNTIEKTFSAARLPSRKPSARIFLQVRKPSARIPSRKPSTQQECNRENLQRSKDTIEKNHQLSRPFFESTVP
jgi:hypothetical protein